MARSSSRPVAAHHLDKPVKRQSVNKISNPFPATGIVPPPGRNFLPGEGVQTFTAGTVVFANNYFDHPTGYVQQWNLDLQRELPAGFFVDVAYAGSKGTHLPGGSTQVDQLPDQYFAQAAAGTLDLFQQVSNPFTTMIGNGTALGGSTVSQGQLLLPYPQYNGVNFNGQGIYDSIYHSLQVSAQKRFAGGGTLLVAYTNAKLISNTDTLTSWLEDGGTGGIQDNYNLRAERSRSAVRQGQEVPLWGKWTGREDRIRVGRGWNYHSAERLPTEVLHLEPNSSIRRRRTSKSCPRL